MRRVLWFDGLIDDGVDVMTKEGIGSAAGEGVWTECPCC